MVTDGKKTSDRRHKINILLVTPLGVVFLTTKDVSDEGRAAPETANQWIDAINGMKPSLKDHLVTLISDTPSVNRAAGLLLEAKFPSITWLPCLAHCLNLFYKDTVKLDPTIKQLYSNVKKVVHHFWARGSPAAALRARLQQQGLAVHGVRNICELRFGNFFIVVARLILCHEAIYSVCTSPDHVAWVAAQTKKDRDIIVPVVEIVHNKPFWDACRDFITLLSPVHKWLRRVDTNAIIIGEVYMEMFKISEHFKGLTKLGITRFNNKTIRAAWSARWEKSHSPFHSAGET